MNITINLEDVTYILQCSSIDIKQISEMKTDDEAAEQQKNIFLREAQGRYMRARTNAIAMGVKAEDIPPLPFNPEII